MFLTGCSGKNNSKPVRLNLRSISFTADVTYYNENYSAECIIDAYGGFVAMLTKPDSLSGLTFEFTDTCKLKFNGIEIDNAERFLPQNSSFSLVNDIINSSEQLPVVKDGKNYVIHGEINGQKYSFVIAPSGLPISLSMTSYGLNADFKNVSIINKKAEEN